MRGCQAPPVPIGSGSIRILATSSAKRLPKLPTSLWSASGFEVNTWLGFVAPRGTPQDIVDTLARTTKETINIPAVAERLSSLGAVPADASPAQLAEVLGKDQAFYADAIRSARL
jgi:tripartite-type tricarboxylate transporter receptor subunit TctC